MSDCLPMEAFLLVTDVLDGRAHRAFDLLVGDGLGTAGFVGDHHLVGGGRVWQAARISQLSIPAFGPSRDYRSTISSEIR